MIADYSLTSWPFVLQTLIIRGLPRPKNNVEVDRTRMDIQVMEKVPDVNPTKPLFMNDDRLSDSCWIGWEVEPWERGIWINFHRFPQILLLILHPRPFGMPPSQSHAYAPTFSFPISSSSSLLPAAPQKGWSKQNLKNGRRGEKSVD